MIRVQRSPQVPEPLATRGPEATKELLDRFHAGETVFDFDSKLYGAAPVRGALLQQQREKCAFCESKVSHVAFGDVEHFRPKGGVRQRRRSKLRIPGYFWLAYEWTNLLASCPLCNQRFKRNLFPVRKGTLRARSPEADVQKEDRGLLDPAADDPSQHLAWNEHVLLPRQKSRRGRLSIRVYGLNRRALSARRDDKLKTFKALVAARTKTQDASLRAALDAEIARQLSDAGEYSAMLRAWHAAHAP